MNASPHVEPELLHSGHDRSRTSQRRRRLGESREEAVAGCVLLTAPVRLQLAPDHLPKTTEHDTPAGVTELRGEPRRADDVEEEHRREPPTTRRGGHASIMRPPCGPVTRTARCVYADDMVPS